MYIAPTVPGRYTLEPLSLFLYLEEEEEEAVVHTKIKIIELFLDI